MFKKNLFLLLVLALILLPGSVLADDSSKCTAPDSIGACPTGQDYFYNLTYSLKTCQDSITCSAGQIFSCNTGSCYTPATYACDAHNVDIGRTTPCCAVGEVPKWDGAGWSCGAGGVWNQSGSDIYYDAGNVGIGGTSTPRERLDVFDGRIIGDAGVIDLVNPNIRIEASELDSDIFFKVNKVGVSTEAMRIDSATGNVGIGITNPGYKLDVNGNAQLGQTRFSNSDIYFTKTDHNHTGIGNALGYAAIENAANYDALMILGRAGEANGRQVKLWDYLQVNGSLDVTGDVTIGSTLDTQGLGRMHLHTDELLYLLAGSGVYITSDWGSAGKLYVSDAVGIGTTSPGEKLEVVGNVESDGYKFRSAKTYYYQIGHTDFVPGYTNTAHSITNDYISLGGTYGYAFAPIHLPDGATMKELDCYISKTFTTANYWMDFTLYKANSNWEDVIASKNVPASTYVYYDWFSEVISLEAISLNEQVNNQTYRYYLKLENGSSCLGICMFFTCKLKYEISEVKF